MGLFFLLPSSCLLLKFTVFFEEVAAANPTVRSYLEGKKKTLEERLERSHVTLAHKRSHGVAAVVSYGELLNREVPVEFTELIYNDRMAALTAHVGTVEGNKLK